MAKAREEGRPVDPEIVSRFKQANLAFTNAALEIEGELPTNSGYNGELSHPVVLSNLMESVLDGANVPLTESQRAEISSAGSGHETEYERLQASYDDDTPALRRIMDEMELKQVFVDSMKGALTREQLDALHFPLDFMGYRGEFFSAGQMIVTQARFQNVGSESEVRRVLTKEIASRYQLGPEHIAGLGFAADTYFESVQPIVSAVRGSMTLDQAVAAGLAQSQLLEAILQIPGLPESTRSRVLKENTWLVPGLE